MAKMKKPVTTKSDEKTRQYILDLMKSLPAELFALVTELRDISAVIRTKADKATAVGPLWRVMQEEQVGLSDKKDE